MTPPFDSSDIIAGSMDVSAHEFYTRATSNGPDFSPPKGLDRTLTMLYRK